MHVIPFVTQPQYDQLLWCCDLNIVRGEDSFVRAQWAGKPFLWHIYPQTDGTHLNKLDAFLTRYTSTLEPAVASQVRQLHAILNQQGDFHAINHTLREHGAALQKHAQDWVEQLLQHDDLATQLVQDAKIWLQ